MREMEEQPWNWAGCQGASCCPLASELRKCEEHVKRMEYRLGRKCGKLSQLLMQASQLLVEFEREPSVASPPIDNGQENIIRECVRMLMDARNGNGCYLVQNKSHWQAVYRILVDKQLGIADGDYVGFERLAWRIEPANCRIPFSVSALKQISKTNFTKPFNKWNYDPAYFKTRRPFDQMVAVGSRFQEILEAHGL